MATLTSSTIAATYLSLLKVEGGANEQLTTTPKVISDGNGNDSKLWLSTDSVLIAGSGTRLEFNTDGSGEYISGNGTNLTLTSGAEINLDGTIVDINANADVSGTLVVGGILTVNNGAVFNEASADVDFRVESNGDANMLFVDGGTNRVGIGTGTPSAQLHIKGAAVDSTLFTLESTGSSADNSAPEMTLLRNANLTDGGNIGIINFKGLDSAGGEITYAQLTGEINDETAGQEDGNMRLSLMAGGSVRTVMSFTSDLVSDGYVGINHNTALCALDVRGVEGKPATSGTTVVGVLRVDGQTNSNVLDFGTDNATPWGCWIQSTNRTNLATGYPLYLNPNGGFVGIGNLAPKENLHIAGADDTNAAMLITAYDTDTAGNSSSLRLFRARGTQASPSIVADGDRLGSIHFGGWLGSTGGDYYTNYDVGASILAVVDGTPSNAAEDIPTELIFQTSPDGSGSPSNRMVIKAEGNVGIGKSTPLAGLHVGNNGNIDLIPVGMFDGTSSNGFLMLADDYTAGETGRREHQLTIGVTHSTGATFIGSMVTASGTDSHGHADGWKSSTDIGSRKGAAYIVDGIGGSHTWYTGPNSGTVANDATKTLQQSLVLASDGDLALGTQTLSAAADNHRLGVGTGSPTYKLDVFQNKASSYAARFWNDGDTVNRYGIFIQCGTDNGSTSSETIYILAGDGDGNQVGKIIHDTDGSFKISATSDARLKENIADTQVDGLSICNQIKVREFNWKDYKGGLKNRAGFIAQEVEAVWAEAAQGTDGAMKQKLISEAVPAEPGQEEIVCDDVEDKNYGKILQHAIPAIEGKDAVYEEVIDPMSVSEASFIPVMLKAIQQLSAKVTALENE